VLWAKYFGVETRTSSRKNIKYQVNAVQFVGAIAELLKANISYVYLSVCSHETTRLPPIFVKLALAYFQKISRENSSFI
jgi:hypothetical protein